MAKTDVTTELTQAEGDSEAERLRAAVQLTEAQALEAEAELKLARARTAAVSAAMAANTGTGRSESATSTASVAVADSEEIADDSTETAGDENDDLTGGTSVTDPKPQRSRRIAVVVAVAALAIVIAAGAGISGYLFDKHESAKETTTAQANYIQAARQGVINILSVDFNSADADIKRILDNSTGKWQEEFSPQAAPFVDVVKQAKVVTTAAISGAGLEKVNPDDSAQVLVAASAKVTNSAGAQEQPRSFRVRVTVTPNSGQLKVSNMEYIAS